MGELWRWTLVGSEAIHDCRSCGRNEYREDGLCCRRELCRWAPRVLREYERRSGDGVCGAASAGRASSGFREVAVEASLGVTEPALARNHSQRAGAAVGLSRAALGPSAGKGRLWSCGPLHIAMRSTLFDMEPIPGA